MKKLLLLGLAVLLYAGSSLALKMQVYNAIKGHTPVAVTFASEKGHGVKAEKPLIIMSGKEQSKDVVLGVSLAQVTINGNMLSIPATQGKGAFWRLELTEGQSDKGCPMIQYELFNVPRGAARKNPIKRGLVGFVSGQLR